MPYQAEYIWIDGTEPSPLLRSKTRIVPDGKEPGIWGFDGSSTNQALGHDSDCVLRPVWSCPDPLRGPNDMLVMCEVSSPTTRPTRPTPGPSCGPSSTQYGDLEPMFGIEQEYTFFKDGRPLGWPAVGYPAPQGPYYCGVGGDKMPGREIVELHTAACIDAGIAIEGTNAEVMMGQWEFQLGVLPPLEMGDQLWVARWLLFRIAEDFGVFATLEPKPILGDWNGAGAHTNFSTKAMRGDGRLGRHHRRLRGHREARRRAHRRLRRRHREPPDRRPRDRPLHEVHLRHLRPGRVHPHPVEGGRGQEGLARGPSSQRQHGPLRGHRDHGRDRLRRRRRS